MQFLLLTSQYLQGTHKSVHTWTIHGLAVKGAMSIGLHSRDIASKFTPLEQEIRKRTWFGCILLDRLASLLNSFVITCFNSDGSNTLWLTG